MNIEKRFISNYLTKKHYKFGEVFAFALLSLCTILSLFYWDNSYAFSNLLSANKVNIFEHKEYWRLFTTSFIHADLEHLLANSLMLFILSYFVISFYGLYFGLITALGLNMITNFVVINSYVANTTLVGASGIVYYLWGFWLVQYFFLQTHMSYFERFLRIGAVFLILLVPTQYSPRTSYMAHYVGFFVGNIFSLLYYLVRSDFLKSYEKWNIKYILEEDDLLEDQTNYENIKYD